MALDDITLDDGQSTPVSHVFQYAGTENKRVVRSDYAADPETPLLLTMGHMQSVRGGVKYDNHLWRLDVTILDADGVTAYVNNFRMMADVARKVLSTDLANDFAAYPSDWLTPANVLAWLRGSFF